MGFFKTLTKVAKGDVKGAAQEALKTVAGEENAAKITEALSNVAQSAVDASTNAMNRAATNISRFADNSTSQQDANTKTSIFTKIGHKVIIAEGVKTLDEGDLEDFPADVEEIVFPSSITDIYAGAFPEDMENLRILDFSSAQQLDSIEDDTFTGCSNLKRIVFPRILKSLPLFSDCDDIVEIHCGPEMEDLNSINGTESGEITAYVTCRKATYDEDFCRDCRQIYLPKELVAEWRDNVHYDEICVQIDPLPCNYGYPMGPISDSTDYQDAAQQIVSETKEKYPEVADFLSKVNPVSPESCVQATPPAPPIAQIQPQAPSCPPTMPEFKFHAIIEGQQRGPYNKIQFKRLVDAEMVIGKTMVWCEGMSDWKKAEEVEEMEEFFPKSSQMMPPPIINGGCPPPPPFGC